MTANEKKATQHAARIEWDTEVAYEYAYALLEDCNCATMCAALKVAHDKQQAEWEATKASQATQ